MRGRELWEMKHMKKTLAILAVAGLASVASAQTFPGAGVGAIPDNGGPTGVGLDITFAVSGTSIGNSLDNVSITLTHSWAGDIVAVLTAPNGDNVQVMGRLGAGTTNGFGNSNDLSGTYRFFNAGTAMSTTGAVPAGDYARYGTLGGTTVPAVDADDYTVFTGDDLNGTWHLFVTDWAGSDTGSVSAAAITIVPAPGALALLGLGGLAAGRRRRA